MPKEYPRSVRVADNIARVLAPLIQQGLHDPRIGNWVTITHVKCAPNLSWARVYYSLVDGDPKEIQKGLEAAQGFLRTVLANKLTIRRVPQLSFALDEHLEKVLQLEKVIHESVRV